MAQREDWRRRCEWCGDLIGEDRHARRIFCSAECKSRDYGRERAEIRAKLICKCCGKPIEEAGRFDRMYCGPSCKLRAWYLRDPEIRRARARVRYWRNPEASRARVKAYRRRIVSREGTGGGLTRPI
jgi:hypothetical protein